MVFRPARQRALTLLLSEMRMGARRIEALLEDIYDAAVDADRWPAALAAMAGHFGSGSAHLSFENMASTQGRMISFGTDPRYAASYGIYYVSRNVLWQAFVQNQPPGVVSDRHIMPRDQLSRTEFYNDFLRPQGGEELLVSQFLRDAEGGATLTLWRASGPGPWRRKDFETLTALTPHLARAVHIGRHIDAAGAVNRFSEEALYRLERGLIILARDGVVLFANAIAERLLRDGCLRLRHGRLCARSPENSRGLDALIGAAAARKVGGSLIIARDPDPPLLLMVSPVRADHWNAIGGHPGAMVLTKDLVPPAGRSLQAFSSHHRLTPAETRLARELLAGDGIAAAAARLNISETTARTHRGRLFAKTGARRQAELVRMLLDFSDGTLRDA
jgi:DNA-binding CsgD family transcriptional regulator